jgi:hypothetical protein
MNDRNLPSEEKLPPQMMPALRFKVGQEGTPQSVEPDQPEDLSAWRDHFQRAFGTTEVAIADALFNQLVNVLHTDPTKPLLASTPNLALALLHRLAPADELEAMLALQMIVAHFASMDASRRALHVDQSAAGRQAYLGLARKLMALFNEQITTLNRLRGKPSVQRVIIERLNLEAGAQAVVGAFATRSGGPGDE